MIIINIPADYMFIEKGTLIEDLSNDYGCDFGGPVVDYKICIHSGKSNDCFNTPCGNGHIYTSLCSDSPHSDGRVSLEVDAANNGTVVSIFCARTDCKGFFSNVMLFNVGIRKFQTRLVINTSVSHYFAIQGYVIIVVKMQIVFMEHVFARRVM